MGIPPERVAYIPNGPGIPDRQVTAAERDTQRQLLGLGDRPTLLLYSRLFEFDTARLANVLAGVRAAVPDLVVLTVGVGLFAEDAARFREQLAQRGLLESVIDVGWAELELQLPQVLAAADVGIYLMDDTLLNRTKCPVKLADMMQAGVPVVAEAVGQVTEYIRDGETGVLRPSGDVNGVTAAVVGLLRDPEQRQKLAAAAQKRVTHQFSWNHLSKQLEKIYQAT
jgi:glycosyltransferase involved in cell wall biosynthesis